MKSIINKTVLIIFSLFVYVVSNGQEIDLDFLKLDDYVKFHNHEASNTVNSYLQIDGTPYLYEEFKPGKIITKDSIIYQGSFRYDIYADQMEFKSQNNVFTFRDPWTIATLEFVSHTFVYVSPLNEMSEKGAFFELIVPGRCHLLQKRKVVLNEPQQAKPYVDAKPASFSKGKTTYYVQIGNKPLQKITGKKSLVEALEDHSHEIEVYIKQNNMSPKKLADLVDLVNYYNRL